MTRQDGEDGSVRLHAGGQERAAHGVGDDAGDQRAPGAEAVDQPLAEEVADRDRQGRAGERHPGLQGAELEDVLEVQGQEVRHGLHRQPEEWDDHDRSAERAVAEQPKRHQRRLPTGLDEQERRQQDRGEDGRDDHLSQCPARLVPEGAVFSDRRGLHRHSGDASCRRGICCEFGPYRDPCADLPGEDRVASGVVPQ